MFSRHRIVKLDGKFFVFNILEKIGCLPISRKFGVVTIKVALKKIK